MPALLTVPLKFGFEVIRSYKRLSYRPWTALAEFVDNSTESYLLNRKILDAEYARDRSRLKVSVDYDRKRGAMAIRDNAMGMSEQELRHALSIGAAPLASTGRARYGMGLKTAASWLGNVWTVRTTKLGDPHEYEVTVDVEKVARGDNKLKVAVNGADPSQHFTVVEISQLNKPIETKTYSKVKDYLRSMYRREISTRQLDLTCFGQELAWDGPDFDLRLDSNGRPIQHRFNFELNGKTVVGWAGILKKASRARAGFTIVHSGRIIRGWPDAWRPRAIFGQVQGSNDLVNQRLVGEVELDDFEVSHTKDDILWFGTEEDDVGDLLRQECADLIRIAKLPIRETGDLTVSASDPDLRFVASSLQAELVTPELSQVLTGQPNGDRALYEGKSEELLNSAADHPPDFLASFSDLTVSGYLSSSASLTAPYAASRLEGDNRLIIVLNTLHPYVQELDRIGLLDHLRHTVFQALALWRSRVDQGSGNGLESEFIKDRLFRVPALVRQRSMRGASGS